MNKTMIQLNKETVAKLQTLKRYPRETYDEIINTLIDDSEVEILTEEDIKEIEKGLEDVRKGRVKTMEEVAKELNVKL